MIVFSAIIGRYVKLLGNGIVDTLEESDVKAGGTSGIDWDKIRDGIRVTISKFPSSILVHANILSNFQ